MLTNQNSSSPDSKLVQFSKLNENNKAQFLEFLIKNNISFNNEGKQNFTAKVTVKTKTNILANNKTTNLNNNSNKPNTKGNSKVNSNKYRSPLKEKKVEQKRTTSKSATKLKSINQSEELEVKNKTLRFGKENQQAKIKNSFSSTKKYQRNNSSQKYVKKDFQTVGSSKTPQKIKKEKSPSTVCRLTISNQQIHQQNEEDQYFSKASTFSKRKNNQNVQSSPFINSLKSKHSISPSKCTNDKVKSTSRSPKPKAKQIQNDSSLANNKRKAYQSGQKAKQTTTTENGNSHLHGYNTAYHSQQNRLALACKYAPYFNHLNSLNYSSSVHKQRPVRWSIQQLEKLLDQFYDENFIKNTHQILINGRKVTESLSGRNNSFFNLSVEAWMEKKFNKNSKTIEYNLINILYSIAYYLSEGEHQRQDSSQNSCTEGYFTLKIFQSFMTQNYQFEEYLFFLFARNVLKKQFKKSFINIAQVQDKNGTQSISIKKKASSPHFNMTQTSQNIKASLPRQQCVNKKQIDRFLKHIVGKESEILQQYHQMIFEQIKAYEIGVNQFLSILLKDYQIKRIAAMQSQRQKQFMMKGQSQQGLFTGSQGSLNEFIDPNVMDNKTFNAYAPVSHYQQSSLDNTFHKILNIGYQNVASKHKLRFDSSCQTLENQKNNQKQINYDQSMEELTFGQDTKQFINLNASYSSQQSIENDPNKITKFWKNAVQSNSNDKKANELIACIKQNDFNGMIAEKLAQKTKELMEILSSSNSLSEREQENYKVSEQINQSNQMKNERITQLQEMLFNKVLALFCTVIQMNKIKWLKQLCIQQPNNQDIQYIEEIQLFYRQLKKKPSSRDISEFCKMLLTVRQVTEQLANFFM